MSASDSFWSWSTEIYSRPEFADRLLHLQDAFELDVNMILWCCWAGLRGGMLPDLVIRKGFDVSKHWSRDVTAPLRTARRALKTPPRQAPQDATEALRGNIKEAELESERLQQCMLEALLQAPEPPADLDAQRAAARQNLAAYAALAGAGRKSGFSVGLLLQVVDAATSDVD